VEKSGIPVAALVSADDLARLQERDRAWDEGTKAMERFSEAFADVPVAELEARIDEIIAEGRAKEAEARRSA
jgi:orotate phosphoribosyltransferase-like protein